MICRKIKCKDYLADDGEPCWCFMIGQPAEVAAAKCPKLAPEQAGKKGEQGKKEKKNGNT